MSIISLLFFVLFNLINTDVDCSFGGFACYPKGDRIEQKSRIIIDAYFLYSNILDSLGSKYPVYLSSEQGNVDLEIVEYNVGMYNLSQVILEPKSRLQLGIKYTLQIDNLPKRINLNQWNSETHKSEPISWTVEKVNEHSKLEWLDTPQQIDEIFTLFGCGPEVYAVFDLKTENYLQTFVHTELENLTTNEIHSYWLPLDKSGKLKIGHGMCAGAFNFENKTKYKIRFKLRSLNGISTSDWTDWIKVKSPYNKKGVY